MHRFWSSSTMIEEIQSKMHFLFKISSKWVFKNIKGFLVNGTESKKWTRSSRHLMKRIISIPIWVQTFWVISKFASSKTVKSFIGKFWKLGSVRIITRSSSPKRLFKKKEKLTKIAMTKDLKKMSLFKKWWKVWAFRMKVNHLNKKNTTSTTRKNSWRNPSISMWPEQKCKSPWGKRSNIMRV